MSYRRRRNRNKIPVLVERVLMQQQVYGESYEEANWAKLSPKFREAHNRLRLVRGLAPIPPPKVDLYVVPQRPQIDKFDPSNREFVGAAREFMQPRLLLPGEEGFTVNGVPVKS